MSVEGTAGGPQQPQEQLATRGGCHWALSQCSCCYWRLCVSPLNLGSYTATFELWTVRLSLSILFCQSLIGSDLETELGPRLDCFQLKLDGSSVRPQCLVASVRPAGSPRSLRSQQMVSWENWQKPVKVKNSHPSQLAEISIDGAWVREEGEISCPFLSKFRLAGKTLVIDPLFQG